MIKNFLGCVCDGSYAFVLHITSVVSAITSVVLAINSVSCHMSYGYVLVKDYNLLNKLINNKYYLYGLGNM